MEELTKTVIERFNGFDLKLTEMTTTISSLAENLKEYKAEMANRINVIESNVTKIDESQKFIAEQYDKSKTTMDNLIKKNTQLDKENKEMNGRIKELEHKFEQEKISRIEQAQYQRRNMLEIYGIPVTENENCVDIIDKLANLAKIEKFNRNMVEVAHRIGTKQLAAIIMMFKDRNDRDNFYAQKAKIRKLHVNQILSQDEETIKKYPEENEKRNPDTFIFVNESLPPENKELMRETRNKAKEKSYKFVWTHKGGIRVRKTTDSQAIKIRSKKDLDKIV